MRNDPGKRYEAGKPYRTQRVGLALKGAQQKLHQAMGASDRASPLQVFKKSAADVACPACGAFVRPIASAGTAAALRGAQP